MNPPQRGRRQHAPKSPQRDRRKDSDPPRRAQAEAIPCPPAATRWPRRFGERGWVVRPHDGSSTAGLRSGRGPGNPQQIAERKRDSLIRAEISLIADLNSLLGKYREFRRFGA